jgi:hypothetical protein
VSDSEEKKDQPQAEKPSEALVFVKNKDGSVREAIRTANGTFKKKPKPLIPTIEFTRQERKLLNSVRSDKDGLTEYMAAYTNILRIAQNKDKDPKAKMAAVKAFEILRLSALGKPSPSEQELDKLTTQPVRVVVLQPPQMMVPEVQEEKPKKILIPDWVETNPKP